MSGGKYLVSPKDCFDSLEDANRYLIQECIKLILKKSVMEKFH